MSTLSALPLKSNPTLWSSIRLVSIFGFNGTEVIYVTTDDKVYGYGPNRFGCLGIGVNDEDIKIPQLNAVLTDKEVTNLFTGFGHVLALTASGQCYSWGENTMGQLGIGTYDSPVCTPTPVVLSRTDDLQIVAISCGNRHTLALTTDGCVYGWGRNTFGAIGDQTWCWRPYPVRTAIEEPIASISCGKCHSLALSRTGRVYLWGLHDFGQLGRPIEERDYKICDDGLKKERAFNSCPELIPGFEDIVIQKACCGPNHTILLSSKGDVYTFGLNDFGQIGDGTYESRDTPFKIEMNCKFKDIVAHFDNNLTIALSDDDIPYVFGYSFHKKGICVLTDPTKWMTRSSLIDVYARHSGGYKSYKTIIIGQKVMKSLEQINNKTSDKTEQMITNTLLTNKPSFVVKDYNMNPMNYSNEDILPSNVFRNYLIKSFDNHMNFDFEFVFNEKSIYCHKTILQIRNKQFWDSIKDSLVYNNEVYIEDRYSYQSMLAFIKYLYSITPEVNVDNCYDLLRLATQYREQELRQLCSQFMESVVNLKTVSKIYDMAVNYQLQSLESYCEKFATKHWKSIFKSKGFESMSDTSARKLIAAICRVTAI
ncbi:RCC1 and BTB domain-containing protein 2-like [Oppia nitens]|uniref:RCC1 and BTB domain-containing protein 2-like n=1 Tax=Oppia nitens TaxID=1686743 RepID=UPI0023DB4AD5|nr:RCC1 and BTB domain-containing protein 2-like [Oppia nitens]